MSEMFIFTPLIFFIIFAVIAISFVFIFISNVKKMSQTNRNHTQFSGRISSSGELREDIPCENCGTLLQRTEKYCPTCGATTQETFQRY
jgi:rubrerythrin